jgi:hypothetical protein
MAAFGHFRPGQRGHQPRPGQLGFEVAINRGVDCITRLHGQREGGPEAAPSAGVEQRHVLARARH